MHKVDRERAARCDRAVYSGGVQNPIVHKRNFARLQVEVYDLCRLRAVLHDLQWRRVQLLLLLLEWKVLLLEWKVLWTGRCCYCCYCCCY